MDEPDIYSILDFKIMHYALRINNYLAFGAKLAKKLLNEMPA